MAVVGRLDEASVRQVSGWAWDPARPHAAIPLVVSVDGTVLAQVIANAHRPDLAEAGIGDGHHGFAVQVESRRFPPGAGSVRVQDAATLADLTGSPMALAARLLGRVEEISHERISGWAWNTADPAAPVRLRLEIDGAAAATVVANRHRADLEAANIGAGRHGFSIDPQTLALPLTPAVIRVVDCASGAELENSPGRLEAPLELQPAARAAVATLMASPGTAAALQDRVRFLAEQRNAVLQRLADLDSGGAPASSTAPGAGAGARPTRRRRCRSGCWCWTAASPARATTRIPVPCSPTCSPCAAWATRSPSPRPTCCPAATRAACPAASRWRPNRGARRSRRCCGGSAAGSTPSTCTASRWPDATSGWCVPTVPKPASCTASASCRICACGARRRWRTGRSCCRPPTMCASRRS